MADGNFLTSLGIDVQLVTAGSAGGLVKALVWKQKVFDACASMVVGALIANYFGASAASMLSSIEMFGVRPSLRAEVGAFFVGIFAFLLVEQVAKLIRAKFGKDQEDDEAAGGATPEEKGTK